MADEARKNLTIINTRIKYEFDKSELSINDKFMAIMHNFPLGYSNDSLIIGKWFEDKDLLASVKDLYALKKEIFLSKTIKA